VFFFFSSRRRHTRSKRDWSSDVCSSDLFSGDAEFARACVDRGWYLSFAGTVTFKNAADLRAALAEVGLGQVMVETDAPFLTPVPYRGRPNSSYLIPHTMATIAEVTGTDLEQ